MLRRVFSWIWPIEVVRTQGHFGELAVRWEDGKLVLNSANGNQSFGSLHRVWQRTLKQVLQPNALPRSVLLLGYAGLKLYPWASGPVALRRGALTRRTGFGIDD